VGLKPEELAEIDVEGVFQTNPRGVEAIHMPCATEEEMKFQTNPRGVEAQIRARRGRRGRSFQTNPRGVEATPSISVSTTMLVSDEPSWG